MATRKKDPAKSAKCRRQKASGQKKAAGKQLVRALNAPQPEVARAVDALVGGAVPRSEPRNAAELEKRLLEYATALATQRGFSPIQICARNSTHPEDDRVLLFGTPGELRALLKPKGVGARFRSAITGLFVTREHAAKHPDTTMRQVR